MAIRRHVTLKKAAAISPPVRNKYSLETVAFLQLRCDSSWWKVRGQWKTQLPLNQSKRFCVGGKREVEDNQTEITFNAKCCFAWMFFFLNLPYCQADFAVNNLKCLHSRGKLCSNFCKFAESFLFIIFQFH